MPFRMNRISDGFDTKKSLLDNNYYLIRWCVIQKRNSSVNGLKKPEILKGFYFIFIIPITIPLKGLGRGEQQGGRSI